MQALQFRPGAFLSVTPVVFLYFTEFNSFFGDPWFHLKAETRDFEKKEGEIRDCYYIV